jgi:NAD(P)-dependent dehydrogenase (short-subunit alcohol dehydrogenase family)
MAELEGKVALITGAGGMRGVGRATALKLARQGADIALTDVHREVADPPPAEVRAGWRGIDNVAQEVGALDLAEYNITVNAVCPGPINTGRLSYWEQGRAQELGISLEQFRGQVVEEAGRATPLGRIAEAEDVANMVAFLASEDASFITGQAYNVNGGLLFH